MRKNNDLIDPALQGKTSEKPCAKVDYSPCQFIPEMGWKFW